MKLPLFLHNPIRVLGGAAALGAAAVLIAARLPGGPVEPEKSSPPSRMEAPDADKLNERIPDVGAVLEKHLFVPGRAATGQNSFPDLVVKGVYIGKESSVILSLKSKPAVNLRVWLGEVESTLNSITDPRDPRQTLVTFLREWPIKEISRDKLIVEHFITGEAETYEVDYVAAKKVKDDAQRGYGQGIMPQDGAVAGNAGSNSKQNNQKNNGSKNNNKNSSRSSTVTADQMMQMQMQMMRMVGGMNRDNPNNQNSRNNNSSGSSKNSRSSNKTRK